MVIARDRRSGVSRSILGGFTLRPERPHPNRNAHLAATDTRSSKAAHALRQAVTFAPGVNGSRNVPPGGEMPTTGGVAAVGETQASVDLEADVSLGATSLFRDRAAPGFDRSNSRQSSGERRAQPLAKLLLADGVVRDLLD
jgi:hypothetical protein